MDKVVIPPVIGTWPKHCEQRAFVAGAAWWQFKANGATMWSSERDEAEDEAVRRYGNPEVEETTPDAYLVERVVNGTTYKHLCFDLETAKQDAFDVTTPSSIPRIVPLFRSKD